MKKIFYIADLHFSHSNIVKFDNRPFVDMNDMELKMIDKWNRAVEKDDDIYIIGDFCWGKEDEWKRILTQLNGNKFLIRGNHDLKEMSSPLKKMFCDVKDYKEITDNKRHVILCHYPMMFYKSSYNPDIYMLCGHVHTTRENNLLNLWKAEMKRTRMGIVDSYGQIINVGCMLPYMDYTPRTLDEIIQELT